MPQPVIAADSKLHFRRTRLGNPFRGIIGIALWIHNPQEFKQLHEACMQQFLEDNRIRSARIVHKSSHIAQMFPGPSWKFRGILRRLAKEFLLIPDTHVNVYFFTLDLRELRQKKIEDIQEESIDLASLVEEGTDAEIVQIYGEPGTEAMQYVSVEKFIEMVRQYFPIVCTSKLCSFLNLHGCDIVLDGCSGPISKAWNELNISGNNITIAPHGDEYNPYISTADVLSRWIDEELRQARLPLNNSVVNRLMKEWKGVTEEIDTSRIQVVHIGNKDLGSIKPLSRRQINRFETIFARRPVYFIFQEERTKAERTRIENSPIMSVIYNRIYETDGSYLFWKPQRHARIVQEGDIAVVYGEEGLFEANKLVDLDYPIQIWDMREE